MLGKDNAITLRQAFDTLRGPPVTSLRHAFDPLRGPPLSSPFRELRELTERMHAGADLRMPDVHAPPQPPQPPQPSQHAPAPTAHRGAPLIHDWPRIIQLDDEFCRTYFANHNRVPRWKEREHALRERLGNKTPHLKTLQQHLPKIALLKERNSRSI
jgi:hypothetical protein